MNKLTRVYLITLLAMIAFASNSLLCRLAMKDLHIDAVSFTLIRIVSGAVILWLLVRIRSGKSSIAGNWISALSLFVYAAGFSLAYLKLSAGLGALLLFGAVQFTMICYGLWAGERLTWKQTIGLILALGGLVGLLLPGISPPPFKEVVLMLGSGLGWGVYSIRGKKSGDPTETTAGNFMRAIPFAVILILLNTQSISLDAKGITYAIISGGITSGLGYAIWYTALKDLNATTAATVQLSVPVIAAIGGIMLLDEELTSRLVYAGICILCGIAIVIVFKRKVALGSTEQSDTSTTEAAE